MDNLTKEERLFLLYLLDDAATLIISGEAPAADKDHAIRIIFDLKGKLMN